MPTNRVTHPIKTVQHEMKYFHLILYAPVADPLEPTVLLSDFKSPTVLRLDPSPYTYQVDASELYPSGPTGSQSWTVSGHALGPSGGSWPKRVIDCRRQPYGLEFRVLDQLPTPIIGPWRQDMTIELRFAYINGPYLAEP